MLGFFSRHKQWEVSSIPDLTGRVAIVTGGNTGLGYITVRELARKGARVYMLSRTETRALAAIEKIKGELGPDLKPEIEYINFDLLSLKSAKTAAEEFLRRETRLDILVNNAGIMATPYELSPDGIEIQACNGTGHFALTFSLLPLLKDTAAMPDSHVRIVNISSGGYMAAHAGTPDFSSLEGLNQKTWSTWVRYGMSKLTNILLTNELQKRLDESGTTNIYCLSVHPGGVATELSRGTKRLPDFLFLPNLRRCSGPLQSWPFLAPLSRVVRFLLLTPEQGALTQLYAATSPEVEEKNLKAALLFPVAQPKSKTSLAEDKDGKLGGQFWTLCEALMRQKA
ncbi:short chain dehydrogenase [Lentinula aciculospora]|uniref:Short chain dehydrogenase n=1 Tax=Lentinula aciculospora TaxID=153920 RepID=A0A9W9AFM0_9AGAR|nr:short chain dehydrogenase [Lentinula aciculospora]